MKYISNSFSPKMLKGKGTKLVSFKQISKNTFDNQTRDAYSVIGHKTLAEKIGKEYNRESISLERGDELYLVLSGKKRKHTSTEEEDENLYYVKCKV